MASKNMATQYTLDVSKIEKQKAAPNTLSQTYSQHPDDFWEPQPDVVAKPLRSLTNMLQAHTWQFWPNLCFTKWGCDYQQ